MRIVFFGTPAFSLPTLIGLDNAHEDIVAVVTRPDAPKGRGRQLSPPEVKAEAARMGVPVIQPASAKDPNFLRSLQELTPDIIIVAAYGKILPAGILTLSPHGCLNLHPSLLPKYRGPAPIQRAIIQGEKKTGVTIIKLTEKMDAGPVLLQKEVEIPDDETSGKLGDRLSRIGAELMVEAVKSIEQGRAVYREQNENDASYAPFIKKEEGEIVWTLSAREINNRVRGLLPWPGSYTSIQGKRIKIIRGRPEEQPAPAQDGSAPLPGTITEVARGGIRVAAGQGDFVILELQEEGKKRMPVGEFLLGHKVIEGTVCGRKP